MNLSGQVKSITYLKNNTGEIMSKLAEDRQPLVITQNGEATAVLLWVSEYDRQMNTIAMLKGFVISGQQRQKGQSRSVDEVFDEILSKDN